MRSRAAALLAGLLAALVAGCSGSSGDAGVPGCTGECQAAPQNFLTEADVQRVIAQAAAEAQARQTPAVITVVDRVGNVLAVFEMTGAPATIRTDGGRGVSGGLDNIPQGIVPAAASAITKAITGAYLSSEGNAFSTRTASQIVQEHFNPNERLQPGGPLFGVQFSQFSCSDVNRNQTHGSIGPKRSPLGLSADPGGLPLYKNGTVVGGIGIEADGVYTLDRDIRDTDEVPEELIAVAGSFGFAAPVDRRGDRITADGRTFRYVDSEATRSNPSSPPAFASLAGRLIAVDGYNAGMIRAGVAFGSAASGVRAATGTLAEQGGHILVDSANANRFAPRASADALMSAREVEAVLAEALKIANRARAQIRRPLGSPVEVTITVVGTNGDILGLTRTRDGPVFGIDVSAQKARGALLFSHPLGGQEILAAPPAAYLVGPGVFRDSSIATYVTGARAFLGDPAAFSGNVAWSMRAIGNIHRPFYPDGIDSTPHGPLSKPYAEWSPFTVGLQLDLIYNQVIKAILGDVSEGCAGRQPAGSTAPDVGIARARNGVQIFAGGMPIYRGNTLIGAIGISGDGIDQDDMVAFLGVHNAGQLLGTGLGHAPAAIRADNLSPQGSRIRYVQCPQTPFNGSSEQNVCEGK